MRKEYNGWELMHLTGVQVAGYDSGKIVLRYHFKYREKPHYSGYGIVGYETDDWNYHMGHVKVLAEILFVSIDDIKMESFDDRPCLVKYENDKIKEWKLFTELIYK